MFSAMRKAFLWHRSPVLWKYWRWVALGWLDREIAETPVAPRAHLRVGYLERLADRLCLQVDRQQTTDGSGLGPHLWNRRVYHPAARRSRRPKGRPAQTRASLYDYRRRLARRSGQPRADRNAPTAARRLYYSGLVGGRSVGANKLVAHGPGIRLQLALCDRAVQHPLSVRTRPRHRFPEGDRQQPAQAPSHSLLGNEPHARRGHLGNSRLLAEHRPAAAP